MEEIKTCERCGDCISELPYLSEVDHKTILCERCYRREQENKDLSDGEIALREYFYKQENNLSKNEYIALELVKAWSGQMGQPAEFESHIDNYLKAIEILKGE